MLSLAVALAALAAPVSTEIVLPSQPAPLHGTLLTPPGASAVAVILPGSGPTDRDGNSPMGVAAGTYRLLAEGLAEPGQVVTRLAGKLPLARSPAVRFGFQNGQFIDDKAPCRVPGTSDSKRTVHGPK